MGMSSSISASRDKRMKMLLVLLVVLGLGVAAMLDPFHLREKRQAEVEASDPALRELVPVDKDDITALEIKPADGEAFKLTKENEQWFLVQGDKKFRAAKERVNPLLADLPHLRSEGLATTSAEKYKDLEVDDGAAILLSVFAGGDTPKVKLSVGKSGPAYTTSFVRVDGGKEVYRAAKNIKTAVGLDFTSFRNKKPWDFETSAVTALSLAAPPAKEDKAASPPDATKEDEKKAAAPASAPVMGAEQSFKLAEGKWVSADGKAAGQNAIKEFLKALSECEVNQFIDAPDAAKTALAAAKPCISVEAGGRKYWLKIGALENGQYFVEDQEGLVYQLGEYNLRFFLEVDLPALSVDYTKEEATDGEAKAGDGNAVASGADEKEPAEGKQDKAKGETDE
jgi:Domain of unknown function (DUF4340)